MNFFCCPGPRQIGCNSLLALAVCVCITSTAIAKFWNLLDWLPLKLLTSTVIRSWWECCVDSRTVMSEREWEWKGWGGGWRGKVCHCLAHRCQPPATARVATATALVVLRGSYSRPTTRPRSPDHIPSFLSSKSV